MSVECNVGSMRWKSEFARMVVENTTYLSDNTDRYWREFLFMPRVTERLLAIVLRIVVEELWSRSEKLAVAIDSSREGGGEPIQGDTVKNFVERRVLISPLQELLSNPVRDG